MADRAMSLQPSVIHAPSTSNLQQDLQAQHPDEIISEDEARRRREQLNRRPSYRMILKDLETVDKQLKKDPDDSQHPTLGLQAPPPRHLADNRTVVSMQTTAVDHPVVSYSNSVLGPHIQVPNGELGLNSLGLQSPAVSIGQYSPQVSAGRSQDMAHNPAATLILPVNTDILGLKPMAESALSSSSGAFVTGNHEWSSNMLAGYNSSPSPLAMSGGGRQSGTDNDESSRKRQVRLLKNREAAKECRRKKKEYVKCLENRVAVLENQNKALIEELKTLKELYCRKEKGD